MLNISCSTTQFITFVLCNYYKSSYYLCNILEIVSYSNVLMTHKLNYYFKFYSSISCNKQSLSF